MTDALVLHRDGIVGTFLPGTAVGDLTVDDPKNLLRWEPWVRASILDFELVTPLRLTKDSATTYTLWHVDAIANQNPTFTPIASMVKPPEATLLAQLALVEGYSALRADRASEILAQLGPGTAFWSSVVNLHPDRTRWTIEIIDIALRLANFVEMRFKQALSCRRPVEFSSQVQPMILTPGHGTLPSGHATESFMIAYLLWRLMKDKGRSVAWLEQLMRQANRIAVNRTVAGVHFPVDSAAGALLGLTLGQYFYRRATGSSNYQSCRFHGERWNGVDDFQWRLLYDTTNDARQFSAAPNPLFEKIADQTVAKNDLLAELWTLAAAEWL
jgi:membrane-associated phospholipid phosphatase